MNIFSPCEVNPSKPRKTMQSQKQSLSNKTVNKAIANDEANMRMKMTYLADSLEKRDGMIRHPNIVKIPQIAGKEPS